VEIVVKDNGMLKEVVVPNGITVKIEGKDVRIENVKFGEANHATERACQHIEA